MEKSFWNNNHELSAVKDELWKKYIPDMGESKYMETELFRAANRLAYDGYNNGWGCNNKTSELSFLSAHMKVTISNEDLANGFNSNHESIVEQLVEDTIKRIQQVEPFGLTEVFTPMSRYGLSTQEWDNLCFPDEDDDDEEW